MTKRARGAFERKPRDFYSTPQKAIVPLFPWLKHQCSFIEPCAGNGNLSLCLEGEGHYCVYECDIAPQAKRIESKDVLSGDLNFPKCDIIITNPPWNVEIMHRMLDKFIDHAPTWLLLSADWPHTKQARPYEDYCKMIVSVGRVKWIEGTKNTGFDNVEWYLFSKERKTSRTIFIFR